jgi:hypothetical protein
MTADAEMKNSPTPWLNYQKRPDWNEPAGPFIKAGTLSIQLLSIDGNRATIRGLMMRANGAVRAIRLREGEAEVVLKPKEILTIDINVVIE